VHEKKLILFPMLLGCMKRTSLLNAIQGGHGSGIAASHRSSRHHIAHRGIAYEDEDNFSHIHLIRDVF
jgi:hypothetical protein